MDRSPIHDWQSRQKNKKSPLERRPGDIKRALVQTAKREENMVPKNMTTTFLRDSKLVTLLNTKWL